VQLTGHELTIASSAVAALAIIGGYLGVRSANRNAVQIAREDRQIRRREELEELKRVSYAKVMTALNALAAASITMSKLQSEMDPADGKASVEKIGRLQRALDVHKDAEVAACDAIAEAELLWPGLLNMAVQRTYREAAMCRAQFAPLFFDHTNDLRALMRIDLDDSEALVSGRDSRSHPKRARRRPPWYRSKRSTPLAEQPSQRQLRSAGDPPTLE
jgi:hypothetical protein